MIAARMVGGGQLVLGLAMVVAPDRVARASAGGSATAPAAIVRVLGLRQAGQGALNLLRPSRAGLDLGAGVDATHLASMIALAVAAPRYRRTAAVSGAIALASIGAGLAARR